MVLLTGPGLTRSSLCAFCELGVCVWVCVCARARVCIYQYGPPSLCYTSFPPSGNGTRREALAQGPKCPLQSSLPTVSCSGRPRLREASVCGECVSVCVLCSGRRGWDQRRALDQMFQVFILRGI